MRSLMRFAVLLTVAVPFSRARPQVASDWRSLVGTPGYWQVGQDTQGAWWFKAPGSEQGSLFKGVSCNRLVSAWLIRRNKISNLKGFAVYIVPFLVRR